MPARIVHGTRTTAALLVPVQVVGRNRLGLGAVSRLADRAGLLTRAAGAGREERVRPDQDGARPADAHDPDDAEHEDAGGALLPDAARPRLCLFNRVRNVFGLGRYRRASPFSVTALAQPLRRRR